MRQPNAAAAAAAVVLAACIRTSCSYSCAEEKRRKDAQYADSLNGRSTGNPDTGGALGDGSTRDNCECVAWTYIAEASALIQKAEAAAAAATEAQLALALRRSSSALRLVPQPGSCAHATALWQRSVALDMLGRHELALAETAAAAKAGAGRADWPTTAPENVALVPTAEAVTQQRRRLAGIVSGYATSSSCSDDVDDSAGDSSNTSPSFFVHASALFYRMVLSGGSELPREINLAPGTSHRLRVHVRLMSEYNRFRRADLQAHLPLLLCARFLTHTAEMTLEVDRSRSSDRPDGGTAGQLGASKSDSRDLHGFINDSGRGTVDLVLSAADECCLHERFDTMTVEIEIFVQGAAAAQVLPVVTPMIRVIMPSPDRGSQNGSTDSDRAEPVVSVTEPAVDDVATQLDGTRAGTRHVLPIPVPAGGQPVAQSIRPPGLYITELTGAHVGYRVWDCALATLQHLWQKESLSPGWANGMRILELGSGTGVVGLGLWMLGADVTLTDQPNILPLTEHNVGETAARNTGHSSDMIRACEYMWGTSIAPLGGPFDLILASDVAYDHRAVGPLVTTLKALLHEAYKKGNRSSVLLAYRCSDVLTPETLKAERKFFSTLSNNFSVAEVRPLSTVEHVQLYSLRPV